MDNPYQPRPDSLEAHRRRVNEEVVITLKDDSARPPATIGSGWQGMILGPAAGQPGGNSSDIKPRWGKRLTRIVFWTWGALVVVAAIMKIMAMVAN